jgi:predicted dehydrogenase
MNMTMIQESARLHLALIGCGRIAESHLEAIAQNPACRLVSVVDVREEAAQKAAEKFGAEACVDYRSVLRRDRLDAVIICTPPATHAEIALFFLEHNVHVLCEKPLAVSVEDATRMVKKAEQKGAVLMMASKFRYTEDVIAAKRLIASGALGEVALFENVFSGKVDMSGRWNSNKALSGGGVLIDNGCHSVDIARYLLGPIVEVQALEGKRVQPIEVEDSAVICFRTASEVMGTIDLSWSLHKERESFLDVYGTKGVAHVGWKSSKYKLYADGAWIPLGTGYDKQRAFAAQLENFAGAVAREEAPRITCQEALESVKVIQAAYRAMRLNQWVEIESEEALQLYRKAA